MSVPTEIAAVKRANGRAQVEAARGEVTDEGPKALVWHGLELSLPPELPATFFFDMVEDEVQGGSEGGGSFALHAVRDLLGADQWRAARSAAREQGLKQQDFIDLVGLIFGRYGMGPGEALASSASSSSAGD